MTRRAAMMPRGRPSSVSLFPCLIGVMLAGVACSEKGSEEHEDSRERVCNGHPELCERPLNAITLATTHNAMSSEAAGWIAPNQGFGITQQLEDGIRGMMLDTMDWNGEDYLCHGYCELGAQPLLEGLGEIEDFLDAHPDNVVLLLFQDGLSVERMVAALDESGLGERAWTFDGEFPTLSELIEAGTNLVVTGESGGPPPAWYHHAWDLIQDTPYSFSSEDAFTCEANRGEATSPLFLVNHWLGTPLPTPEGAERVNAASVLQARAEQCAAERGQRVNLLGVDFYERGDLFSVVDQLNGLD